MAEQKILISIQINDRETKKTNEALKVTKQNFDKLTKAEQDAIVADKQLSLSAKELDKSLTQKAAAANAAAKATDNMRATSGLNNAIIMETSRLASDASYGFTAIANNLSQLVNLVQANVKATGSFKQAIAGLFSAQAAFLIGIQLLITYGDDLYAMLMKNSKMAINLKDVFSEAGKEVQSTSGKFETYVRTLQDSSKSNEEQSKAITGLKKEFPEYINQLNQAGLSLDDVSNNTEKAAEMNDIYRESLIRTAMARAAQNKIEEESAAIIQARIDFESQIRYISQQTDTELTEKDAMKAIAIYEAASQRVEQIDGTFQEKRDAMIAEKRKDSLVATGEYLKEQYDLLQDTIKVRNENINSLVKFTKIELDTIEGGASKRNRIFKEADLDFEKEILSSQQRIEKLEVRHEKDLIAIKINAMGEKAVLKQSEFEQDQSRRLRDFLQSEATLEQKKLAQERYNNSIAESKESLYKYLIQLDNEYNATISDLEERRELEDLSAFGKALQTFNTERLKFQEQFLKSYTDSEIDRVEVAKQLENDRFNNEMLNLKAIRDQRIADGETTYEIDQKILNAEKANTEAKIALAEQERDAKIGIANQVGKAVVAVAGEGSTVGKAASVAMAIMNTKEAFTAALGAKPYGVWNIAQAAAVLAMGMKQVKDIMAVKIPGKDPSAGTGGTVIEAPDFNIVGASQTSQLAETVAGQQAKPIKAFVVGKDISSQQELDRNITNTASFG
jgi:hypothetical protein